MNTLEAFAPATQVPSSVHTCENQEKCRAPEEENRCHEASCRREVRKPCMVCMYAHVVDAISALLRMIKRQD